MKAPISILALFALSRAAHAGDYKVLGVHSDFTMADEQARYRDVYVNMGTNQGIKTGSSIDAFRVISTVDELNQRTGRNISFKIATLKVIHAEAEIAVARVSKIVPADLTPIGSFANVMVGDSVEISNAK